MTARRAGLLLLVLLLLWPSGLLPLVPDLPLSVVVNANLAGEFTIIAISLVVLTGWVGQISLAQGTFVGIGAFSTGLVVRGLDIPFPANLPFAAVFAALAATVLGIVALRVRGLFLAVATLIFAWMADAYLFSADWFVGSGGASSIPNQVIGREGTVTAFDLSDKRTFYLVVLATVLAVLYGARNLRTSKTGRAFFAVRESEMAAVSLGIDVRRYKLVSFALAGGLAGLAGNLVMTDLRTVTPVEFQFTKSLFFLSIAVVGGITSIGGAVAASVLFAGLNELFFRVSALTGYLDIVSVGLLFAVLLGYPGGLGALGPRLVTLLRSEAEHLGFRFSQRPPPAAPPAPVEPVVGGARRAARFARVWDLLDTARARAAEGVRRAAGSLAGRVERIVPAAASLRRLVPASPVTRRTIDLSALARTAAPADGGRPWNAPDADLDVVGPSARADREPVLEAERITVRFGGLVAVNDVSLEVRQGEIVGLIGPNGAGKTTLFNAVAGLNDPAEGTVRLFGEDASSYPVHRRAQMGVGRTFQLIQLLPQLTVFENLLVATHVHNPTGLGSHVTLMLRAMVAERRAREQVEEVVALLGLHDVAHRRVAGLPFGILRQVEIARALVTRAPLLMLDEAASGLDNTETEELMRLLRWIRARLGVSILLIEHDVQMVTTVSDHVYVLDQGALLAQGSPRDVQRDPEVVAAYLGKATELEPV